MAKTINTEALTRAAVVYDNVLRTLPYQSFLDVSKKLKINIVEVDGEDIIINKRRKAGIIRAYKPGLTLGDQKELAKFYESKLKPEMVYAEVNDNVTTNKNKKVLSNAGEPVNHKTKKHPHELMILSDLATSFGEDVVDNMFHAQRDEAGGTAQTSFNGFFHKLNLLITAEEISAAKKNLVTTGAFELAVDNPDDSTANYFRMVNFIKSAHPSLRGGKVILYAAESPMDFVRDDFRKLVRSHSYPSMEEVVAKLRSDAKCPELEVITHTSLGTGDQLILTTPGNLDFGVGKESDQKFVQVRSIAKDPNEVQFWMQAAFDTRINDVHQKLFQTNEQKNTGLDLAGDY